MFVTKNTCYVALKIVSPAVAVATTIYWTKKCPTLLLDLLQYYAPQYYNYFNRMLLFVNLTFCDVSDLIIFFPGTYSVAESFSEAVR